MHSIRNSCAVSGKPIVEIIEKSETFRLPFTKVIAPAKLQVATEVMPLSHIEQAWKAPGKPNIVVRIG